MTLQTSATPHNEDLDKADRLGKWQLTVWILVLLLVSSLTWILISQSNTANKQASSEASQKFTLAQQVAAACALKTQADDLGGLCAKAQQLVKEGPAGSAGIQGPPGDVGAQGPLGPKGEQGIQGNQGVQGLLGLQGIFGKNGIDGAAGEPGVNGTNGADGVAGPAGADGNGTPGANGTPGTDGAQGPAGVNGTNGADGATGATGPAAFPFSFSFTFSNKIFSCTIIASDALATCVAN